MSVETTFDAIVDALDRISARARLNDLVAEIRKTDTKRCGNCDLWMKKGPCPRERGVMVGGPTCNDFACSKFILKTGVLELKQERIAGARKFAASRSLPFPENLI